MGRGRGGRKRERESGRKKEEEKRKKKGRGRKDSRDVIERKRVDEEGERVDEGNAADVTQPKIEARPCLQHHSILNLQREYQ